MLTQTNQLTEKLQCDTYVDEQQFFYKYIQFIVQTPDL